MLDRLLPREQAHIFAGLAGDAFWRVRVLAAGWGWADIRRLSLNDFNKNDQQGCFRSNPYARALAL